MDHFIYNEQHRTIICRVCKYAVTEAHLDRHIRKSKCNETLLRDSDRREAVVAAFHSKETIAVTDLVIPTQPVPSIDGLDVFVDGLQCAIPGCDCKYITRSKKKMQIHARDIHHRAKQRPGRPAKGRESDMASENQTWMSDVKCQQFVKVGPMSKLFEVRLAGAGEYSAVTRVGTTEADWRLRFEAMRKMMKAMREKLAAGLDLVHKGIKGDVNPWVDRTGWARYLEGHRRRKLLPLLNPVDAETEPDVCEIQRRLDKVIRIAQETTARRVATSTRQEINRKDIHSEAKKPFNPYMEADTFKRYSNEFKCIIRYILRVWKRMNQGQDQAEDEQGESVGSEGSSNDESEAGSSNGSVGNGQATVRRRVPKKLPGFQMTDEQEHRTRAVMRAIEEAGEADEVPGEEDEEWKTGRLDDTNRVILHWCISLFNAEYGGPIGDEFNSPVIAALAIVGIRPDGGWVSALSYTPKLSAIVKVFRMMVLQHAWETATDTAGAGAMDVHRNTRGMVEAFMTTHNPSPMKWIHDVRRYGFRIRMTTMSPGTIQWVGDRLRYRDKEFTRLEFQSMVHSVVDKARGVLMDDVLLLGDEVEEGIRAMVPVIPWDGLRDNEAEDAVGYYFMEDPRNAAQWPVDASEWLMRRIFDETRLRAEFVEEDMVRVAVVGESSTVEAAEAGVRWKESRVEKWMQAVGRLKELLLFLMHVTGGGPGRGEEILTVQYRNTAENPGRNVLLEDGLVVFATQYHKGYSISGMPKLVYRYLPREVGELLVWYLWLVLPLQEHYDVMFKEAVKFESFLWPGEGDADGRKWSSERFKRVMLRETGEAMGVELNIADYRQCAAAMTDRWLGGRLDGFEELTEEMMEEDEDDEGCYWKPGDSAVHLQFAHSSHEAAIGYARGIEESNVTTFTMRMRWRQVSEKWHRHLRFPSTMGSNSAWRVGVTEQQARATTSERRWEEEDRQVVIRKVRALQKLDVGVELRRFMGEDAQFRGVQEVTLQAIAGSKARILAVMATGGGKSLTFMLPATFQGAGTTIVIVPMIALRADMKRRCDDVGISCIEWNSRKQPDKASIVLVTPESVFKKGFQGFVNRLRGMHRLDRVVIDECHTVLDSTDVFRPMLKQLRQVMTMGCPVVMLTATMPPTEESRFLRIMGIEMEDVAKFRTGTSRTNISYECQDYDGRDEAVVEKLKDFQRQLDEVGEGGKMIVYVYGLRERIEKLAEAIGAPAFHSQVHEREKRRILEGLAEGSVRTVVATNALGMGVDIPDIRMVVHVDAPDGLRDYAQESGRAGRDGRSSRAMVLIKPANGRCEEEEEGGLNMYARRVLNLPGRRQMRTFVGGVACKRVVLDEYLDGRLDRTKCGGEEEACDVCQTAAAQGRRRAEADIEEARSFASLEAGDGREASFAADSRAQARIREGGRARVAERAEFIEQLQEAVEEWDRVCAICKIGGESGRRLQHPTSGCKNDAGTVREQIEGMREHCKIEAYGGCKGCQLPQDICKRWTSTPSGFKSSGGSCQWRYVVIDVVVSLLDAGFREGEDGSTIEQGSQFVLDEMANDRVDVGKLRSVYEWYGRRIKVGNIETNRLCIIFVKLVRRFEERPWEFKFI